MHIDENNQLVCPRGLKEQSPIRINIGAIKKLEARVQEIAFVTSHKAPELLAAFNRGYLDLSEHCTFLEKELLVAEREANKLRAIILLDKVQDILKEKGLWKSSQPAGSEDLRNAILDSDVEYQAAVEICENITCVVKLLRDKMKGLEMAYNSVKKILGESAFNMSHNSNLSAGGEADVGVGNSLPSQSGFGKSHY